MTRPVNSHLRGNKNLCCAQVSERRGGHSCKNSAERGSKFCAIHGKVHRVQLVFSPQNLVEGDFHIKLDHYPSRKKPAYVGRTFSSKAQAYSYMMAHWSKLMAACRPNERVASLAAVSAA